MTEGRVWQVRLFHQRREAWFCLNTANKVEGAKAARDIYADLVREGWESTLAKYKQEPLPTGDTIEEFTLVYRDLLKRVKRAPIKPTAERYIKSLKFLCKAVGVSRISQLTATTLKRFVDEYHAAGAKEGRGGDSVIVSCNAILRNSRAMFSRKIIKEYKAAGKKFGNPFDGFTLDSVEIKSYTALDRDVLHGIWRDAVALRDGDPSAQAPIRTGTGRWQPPDLRKPHPEAYTILLLELGLGLRRNEADKACWNWLSTDANGRHFIKIQATKHFTPKSKKPRILPVAQPLWDALTALRSGDSEFIVGGREARVYSKEDAPRNIVYRCDLHHRALASWLRTKHGIEVDKPCHLLRKEFGSYVATSFGLFAAQRMLGHSSPVVTDKYYADFIDLPELSNAKFTPKADAVP